MGKVDFLITGATGLFGTAMESACEESKIKYVGLSHESLDISDRSQLEKKIDDLSPNVIINSAAMMSIPSCEENPKKAFEINTLSVLGISKACRMRDITLVQISTNAVFDGRKGDLYFETDTPNPQNVYGLSKYAGELCVQNNLSKYYVVRFPKLFGSRRNITPGFIDKMLDKMRNREEIKVADDRVDTFTYALHAARKIVSIIRMQLPFGVYHVANRGSVSYYDFMREFARRIGYSGKITRAKDSDFPSLAPNPLRVELGSNSIKDMPFWKEALDEYVKTERIAF